VSQDDIRRIGKTDHAGVGIWKTVEDADAASGDTAVTETPALKSDADTQ